VQLPKLIAAALLTVFPETVKPAEDLATAIRA
jgi:hypothetical protein